MTKKLTMPIAVLMALFLAACETPNSKEKSLETTMKQYESAVRWNQWDSAVAMIAPDSLEENPVTRLDLDRLDLFRVTAYTVRSATPLDENKFLQVVQIEFFHKTQAIQRSIIDEQDWRWDQDTGRWLLHSGLPDVTRRY